MRAWQFKKLSTIAFLFIFWIPLLSAGGGKEEDASSLQSLLPEVQSWKFSDAPQHYFPQTLYEYINGAAEIYLAYDFRELIVGQYTREDADSSLTLEIYDMGNDENSFGIYSAERFPDNNFIPVGNQGYLEEGALNFIVGQYYVKLLCFDCGQGSDDILKLFSQEVANRVKDKGRLPHVLGFFPKEGLVQNSERFQLHNFLGYSFLQGGYMAEYKHDNLDFVCIIIKGKDEKDAQDMMNQYLKAKSELGIQEIPSGFRLKDRYYHNIYLARIKNYLCGVMKIKDGFEKVGETYLGMLAEALKKSS